MDSAKYYLDAAYKSGNKVHYQDLIGTTQRDLGEIQELKGDKTGALHYFTQAVVSDRLGNIHIVFFEPSQK